MGIAVPTLCWYPKLPIVGNCRICLVSVEGSPKLIASCATQAAEGQKVTTESHAAVQNRKAVLGMLLERYPVEEIPDGWRTQRVRAVRAALRRPHGQALLARPARGRSARGRSAHPARHVHLHPVHAMRAGVRGHPGGGRARHGVSRRARGDHRRRRWQSRARGVHLVRRVRARVPHRRDPRHHSAREDARGVAARAAAEGAQRVSLLRRGVPDRSRGARQRHSARHEPVDRGDDAEHRLHVREGSLRLRLRDASRPTHHAAHPQRMDEARAWMVVGADLRADGEVGTARRSVDDRLGGGPDP